MATNYQQFSQARSAMRFTTVPTTGSVFFTGSVAGSATGGHHPDAHSATLIQAQSLATASVGDIVHVAPGHAESITGAAGMTFSKAGVTYQGLGNGRNRPTITFTTAIGAQMIVSGANIIFRNMIFDFTGFDAITAAISVTGADVAFEGCEFITNSATAGCVLGILTAATATRFRVSGCRFLGTFANTGTTTTAQIKHEVGVDYCFENNYFCGKMTQAILNATTITNGLIRNNDFHIGTGTAAITMETSSAGMIAFNRAVVASGTAPYAGAAMSYTQNHYTTEGNGPTAGTADAI
jgi:hypothetical protein